MTANAHALARYAALCQEQDVVPIVEPELLMDGAHDVDRCATVTEFVLKTVFRELYEQRVVLEGMVLKPNMVIAGKTSPAAGLRGRGRREDPHGAEALRAIRRARHRVPLRRPVGRGRDRPSRCHEPDRRGALAADLLLWPRPSGGAPEGMVR